MHHAHALTPAELAAKRERFEAFVRRRQELLTIPWIAMTIALGLESIVLSVVADSGPVPVPAWLRYGLAAIGCGLAAASVLLPRRACSDAKVKAQMRCEPDPRVWARGMGLDPEQSQILLEMAPAEQRLVGLMRMFVRPHRLGLGLSQAVAASGFLLGLLCRSMLSATPFLLVALALNGWHYPRLGPLVRRGRKLGQADREMLELERQLQQMTSEQEQPAAHPRRVHPPLRRRPPRPS